jgi:hypothetical protein
MSESAPHLFANWESFYVIVGSSAAALTGLQFVVITLIMDWRRPSTREIGAFATPTIIHFASALLVSAALSAPWPAVAGPRWIIGAAGVAGIVYVMLVIRDGLRSSYRMVLEDWIWHVTLPLMGYMTLAVSGIVLDRAFTVALFTIAGATLLFVAIGIHNAWDTATYVASTRPGAQTGGAATGGKADSHGVESAAPGHGE